MALIALLAMMSDVAIPYAFGSPEVAGRLEAVHRPAVPSAHRPAAEAAARAAYRQLGTESAPRTARILQPIRPTMREPIRKQPSTIADRPPATED
jgi:hypothetical protein